MIDDSPLNQSSGLFLLRLSGEFAPHIFKSALRRFVRSAGGEVIFPVLGKVECQLIFRGTEAGLSLLVDWLGQQPCGLRHIALIEVGEADDFVSALKGLVRGWRKY